MKLIHYILICCFIGLFGCGKSDNISNFSKRKYLEKTPKVKVHQVDMINEIPIYAGTQVKYTSLPTLSEQVFEKSQSKIDSTIYYDTIITQSGEVINCVIISKKGDNIKYLKPDSNGKNQKVKISKSEVKHFNKMPFRRSSGMTIRTIGIIGMYIVTVGAIALFVYLVANQL